MKKPSLRLRKQLQRRLDALGVRLNDPAGGTILECLIAQEAIIISVDRPDGGAEWCYGWKNSRWAPIQTWALAYFDS